MTSDFLISFSLQLLAVALLLAFARKKLYRLPGAWLTLIAFLYSGMSEFLMRITYPGRERIGLPLSSVDAWLLIFGPGLLIYTVSYLLVLQPKTLGTPQYGRLSGRSMAEFFDWRVIALIVAPMYLYAVSGGVGSLHGTSGTNYVQTGITTQFLDIGLPLLSFAVIRRVGSRSFLIVAIVQSVLFELLGERIPIAAGLLILVGLLSLTGAAPSRRHLAILLALVVCALVILSASRALSGRGSYEVNAGFSRRLSATFTGIASPGAMIPSMHQQFISRLDGNALPAYLVQGMDSGIPPVGALTIERDIRFAVPSFINPYKDSLAPAQHSEYDALQARYHVPPINLLPTLFGTLFSYGGTLVFELLCSLLGIGFGLIDRWIQYPTPARLCIALGLFSVVVYYERTVDNAILIARGIVIIIILIKALQASRLLLSRRALDVRLSK